MYQTIPNGPDYLQISFESHTQTVDPTVIPQSSLLAMVGAIIWLVIAKHDNFQAYTETLLHSKSHKPYPGPKQRTSYG